MKFQKNIRNLFLLSIALISQQSCAPVFSELGSARLAGKNHVELIPSASSVSYSENGENDGIQNHLGMQVAYGISDYVDMKLRYERIWFKEGKIEDGVNVIGIGPKIKIIENRIAFSIPIGTAFGDGISDAWELHPTLLLTQPVLKDQIEITLSPKYLIVFCDGCNNLLAANIGISFSSNLNYWSIRPEYGILINPGESGRFGQFSLGISTTIGKSKSKIPK